MNKIGISMIAVAAMALASQAAVVVNWGVSGGQEMVTANADPASIPANYTTTAYLSPTDGTSGYSTDVAGQTRNYYGAQDRTTGKFGINNNGGDGGKDAIQMVYNTGGNGGDIESMIAWESADFLTSDRELESLDMEFETRGGTTTARYLIQTADGWYQSDQAFIDNGSNNWGDSSKGVGDLTWSSFSLFGVTGGGATPADTDNIVSVGAYFDSAVGLGVNWTGAKLRYFEVTAIPEPATLGMIASVGVGVLFIRRRIMM